MGQVLFKTDWNLPFKIFALSEAFECVTPFGFREVISLLSDFWSLIGVQKCLLGLAGLSAFLG